VTDEEQLQANAKLAISTLSPLSDIAAFGYHRESVAWVEGYIGRQCTRTDLAPETLEQLTQVLGSFFGECVIRCYGGRWRRDEGGWGVQFDDSNAAYPINKVRKQFDNGVEGGDSILSFFDSIRPLSHRNKQKPWWKLW
jgi:hypothetical protein